MLYPEFNIQSIHVLCFLFQLLYSSIFDSLCSNIHVLCFLFQFAFHFNLFVKKKFFPWYNLRGWPGDKKSNISVSVSFQLIVFDASTHVVTESTCLALEVVKAFLKRGCRLSDRLLMDSLSCLFVCHTLLAQHRGTWLRGSAIALYTCCYVWMVRFH